MDPNETYHRLVGILMQWNEWSDLELEPKAALDEVADLFDSLDTWLSQGGYLPDEWRR